MSSAKNIPIRTQCIVVNQRDWWPEDMGSRLFRGRRLWVVVVGLLAFLPFAVTVTLEANNAKDRRRGSGFTFRNRNDKLTLNFGNGGGGSSSSGSGSSRRKFKPPAPPNPDHDLPHVNGNQTTDRLDLEWHGNPRQYTIGGVLSGVDGIDHFFTQTLSVSRLFYRSF